MEFGHLLPWVVLKSLNWAALAMSGKAVPPALAALYISLWSMNSP